MIMNPLEIYAPTGAMWTQMLKDNHYYDEWRCYLQWTVGENRYMRCVSVTGSELNTPSSFYKVAAVAEDCLHFGIEKMTLVKEGDYLPEPDGTF